MKLCVIPTRGGSKRIPRKNVRPFCRKPLIAWSIEAALGAGIFDDVVVSTDSEEIARVAQDYGASVSFRRPSALGDDFTPTSTVVRHAAQWFLDGGASIGAVCCLYATAPFVTSSRLRSGYEILMQSGRSHAFSATSFAFPIERALHVAPEGGVEPIFPDSIGVRSQDLEEAVHDAGQFCWGTLEACLNEYPVFSPDSTIVRLPRSETRGTMVPGLERKPATGRKPAQEGWLACL